MTEISFIRHNIDKWSAIEQTCEHADTSEPDELAQAYEELTADLAFAQTHYPEARITSYLNDLALSIHVRLYRRQPNKWHDVWTFVRYEVPQAMWEGRHYLLASFIVFLVGTLIGVVSQANDPEFARIILGNDYVDMTMDNIKHGAPMAVYSGNPSIDMFLSITWNNVGVAMMCFASGLLTFWGTGTMLIQNAVMVGSFQTFFIQQGLGYESALAIWLHGTLEMSAIIVGGGAGFMLGTGWLFPGTLKRKEAFQRSARLALRIVVGMVPIFVVAGFIEGFFTRHTEWPDGLRFSIIYLSAAFVIYYVVMLPRKIAQQSQNRKTLE